MNYYAHGMRFVDRPYFLAGTAIPDWLIVADRRVRMRDRRVAPRADGSRTDEAELAAGILQHFEDDRRFHKSRAFVETSGELTRRFRRDLGEADGFRHSFLGHIVSELLLDGLLIEEDPRRLDDYYAALDRVDVHRVEAIVNSMARTSTSRLAAFILLFRRSEFLRDYQDDRRLLFRLNQVMQRIRLKPLPEHSKKVLACARRVVKARVEELLPFSRQSA